MSQQKIIKPKKKKLLNAFNVEKKYNPSETWIAFSPVPSGTLFTTGSCPDSSVKLSLPNHSSDRLDILWCFDEIQHEICFVGILGPDGLPVNCNNAQGFDYSYRNDYFIWLKDETKKEDQRFSDLVEMSELLQDKSECFALFTDKSVYIINSPLFENYELIRKSGVYLKDLVSNFDSEVYYNAVKSFLDDSQIEVVDFWISCIDNLIGNVLYHIQAVIDDEMLIYSKMTRDSLFFPVINKCVHFNYSQEKCYEEIKSFISRKFYRESYATQLILNAVELALSEEEDGD